MEGSLKDIGYGIFREREREGERKLGAGLLLSKVAYLGWGWFVNVKEAGGLKVR
jgi:hypothetical protein